jgi:hypothetical protein
MSNTGISPLADEALDAFWEVIASHFPKAVSGDLSPHGTIRLQLAAEEAVAEWIANNVTTQHCDITTGYRFKLFREVARFPDFVVPAGLSGTVTVANEHGVRAKMDEQVDGARHWDNQIHWEDEDEFAADTEPYS